MIDYFKKLINYWSIIWKKAKKVNYFWVKIGHVNYFSIILSIIQQKSLVNYFHDYFLGQNWTCQLFYQLFYQLFSKKVSSIIFMIISHFNYFFDFFRFFYQLFRKKSFNYFHNYFFVKIRHFNYFLIRFFFKTPRLIDQRLCRTMYRPGLRSGKEKLSRWGSEHKILDFVMEMVSRWFLKKVRASWIRDSREEGEDPVTTRSSAKSKQEIVSLRSGSP